MDPNRFFQVVPRLLPVLMLGAVALIGLILQRKPATKVIAGTVRTVAGVIILFTAVDLLTTSISPIQVMFGQISQLPVEIESDFDQFLGLYGGVIVLVMVLGFLINLLLARLTPFKYVFLSGHILFWNAFMVTAAFTDGGKIRGLPLILLSSLFLGAISTIFPALIAPFVRQATGCNDFSIGHSTTVLALTGALVGKWFGNRAHSTEDIHVPETVGFLREMVVSTSLMMALLYLVMGLLAGPKWSAEQFGGGSITIWLVWVIFQGVAFGAGLIILLTGVRMMLNEIIPAFHGFAHRVVPEAVPALDCPMLFPYGQNALAIGFPIAVLSSLATLVIFNLAGYQYVLMPLVVAAFFDVGPAAILGNVTGGLRGAILASITGGVLLIVFQALSLPFVTNTAASFINLFGGNDFSVIAIIAGGLARIIGF